MRWIQRGESRELGKSFSQPSFVIENSGHLVNEMRAFSFLFTDRVIELGLVITLYKVQSFTQTLTQ